MSTGLAVARVTSKATDNKVRIILNKLFEFRYAHSEKGPGCKSSRKWRLPARSSGCEYLPNCLKR
jgi:hypothetical protein